MRFDVQTHSLVGDHGSLAVAENDELVRKLAMLIEGECEGLGPTHFQLIGCYREDGSAGLVSKPRGPKRNYRRTDEVMRQVIRYRFLDPQSTPDVIAQKLRQTGFTISTRSVERVIADYGLQKKVSTAAGRASNRRSRSKRKSVGIGPKRRRAIH